MLVGKDWKIESDEMNVTILRRSVARKGKHAGEETWTPEAYFSSLKNALEWLVDNEVQATGLKDLKIVLAKQAELYALIESVRGEVK